MNCVSWCRVRWRRVSQTVMKSFSSPLKRRYQRCDAVRSVTSWRSAATSSPPLASSRSTQASMQLTAAAISSSAGRSTIGTGRDREADRSAALDETGRGQFVVEVEQRTRRSTPGVVPGPQDGRGGEALGGQRLVEDAAHGGRVARRRGGLDQKARPPVVHPGGEPPGGGGDTRG